MAGQCEMPQVVASELELEAVGGGLPFGRLHDARVVDQDVDGPALGVQLIAERGDAGQRRQVEVLDGQFGFGDLRPDLVDRGFTLGAIADRHHDIGACRRQPVGQAEAEAGVGTGDDGQLSGQIGDTDGAFVDGHDSTPYGWITER